MAKSHTHDNYSLSRAPLENPSKCATLGKTVKFSSVRSSSGFPDSAAAQKIFHIPYYILLVLSIDRFLPVPGESESNAKNIHFQIFRKSRRVGGAARVISSPVGGEERTSFRIEKAGKKTNADDVLFEYFPFFYMYICRIFDVIAIFVEMLNG